MAQAPYASRVTNFLRDANNGLASPSPLGVDAELNALMNVVNQVVVRQRGFTNSDGTLRTFASATAQALAGTRDFVATAAQTVFVTTIVWSAAFTSLNVFVYIGGLKLATAAVTVANASGFLQVTLSAQPVSTVVTVAAFESGAGLLSRLQTVSPTDGASLVAINDAGGLYVAVTVEAALQEVVTTLNTLSTNIGNTADLIRRTGAVAFTAAQSMGGFKLTNLADGTSAQDAVTVNQFNAYATVWNALQAYFMRLDGTTSMAASLPMGANKITGLAVGTLSTDAVNKSQLDGRLAANGTVTSTADQNMGGFKITALADPVAETDAINLRTARTIAASFATRTQRPSAGTTSFVVPAGVVKLKVRVWGGGGGGASPGTATTGYGGGGGAYCEATLAVTPAETLTITVGAGGAATATGGNSQILRAAVVLVAANGGTRGDTTGLGGTYAFDASVTGFGINGGGGDVMRLDTTNGDFQHMARGGSSPQGGSGGRQFMYPGFGTGGELGEAPGGGGAAIYVGGAAGAAGRIELEY